MRASAAGVSTVSLPGAALWHVVWTDKDDLTDWQAYFHARNRIVTALLHSSEPHGGDLLTHSRRMDLKHLMSMQYYAVELRHQALRDVLSGPDGMPASLRSALAAARAMGTRHPEAARGGPIEPAAITSADFAPVAPTGWKLRWMTLAALIRHWFRPSRRGGHGSAALPREANAWWILHQYDSACVVTADGDGSTKYVRDRRAHRRLLVESVRLHRQLHREWGTLSQAYRAALPALTSPETWESIFKSRSAG